MRTNIINDFHKNVKAGKFLASEVPSLIDKFQKNCISPTALMYKNNLNVNPSEFQSQAGKGIAGNPYYSDLYLTLKKGTKDL